MSNRLQAPNWNVYIDAADHVDEWYLDGMSDQVVINVNKIEKSILYGNIKIGIRYYRCFDGSILEESYRGSPKMGNKNKIGLSNIPEWLNDYLLLKEMK